MRTCTVPGCERKHYAKGLCNAHWQQAHFSRPIKPIRVLAATLEDRFWALVLKTEGCWEWQGEKANGYGRLRFEGNTYFAHRLSWELQKGEIPDGLWALHKCDNRACVRIGPGHIYLGTVTENSSDMKEHGRAHRPFRKGEENTVARLVEAQIVEIRSSTDSAKVLAERFGVSSGHITSIRNRTCWTHI